MYLYFPDTPCTLPIITPPHPSNPPPRESLCENRIELRQISGFRRGVVETFALPNYYAAYVRSCLPTFQDNYTLEDRADRRR